MENEKNEKKDESVVNVGEAKGKVKNKKVEVKKIIGGKKMVKKDGRYVAIWTCGVCKQILPKTADKVSCEGCMTWCHLDKFSGLTLSARGRPLGVDLRRILSPV